uniref:Bestrophin homolog n=1 Tax=Ascaris lumbricoides TaxID=6252 RepID=A0A0M3HI67_ASCLU
MADYTVHALSTIFAYIRLLMYWSWNRAKRMFSAQLNFVDLSK